jgi:cell division ATPase FtsA
MRESGFEEVLSSGMVLTGGSCVMPGMVELGEDIFPQAGTPRRAQIFRAAWPTWWRSHVPPP